MKNWSVTAASGGRYPGVDPVFFKGNQQIALATALAVKIFQLSTKQLTAKIVVDCTDLHQLVLNTTESALFLLRKSGSVELIGLADSTLQKFDIDSAIRVRHIISQPSDTTLLVLVATAKSVFDVGQLDLSTNTFTPLMSESSPVLTNADTGIFAVSPSKTHVAFITPKTRKTEVVDLTSYSPSAKNLRVHSLAYPARRINGVPVSLAVSDSGLVAVGNQTGVIDVFYAENVMRTLKWHLEPVQALQFTLNDEYLISGGGERVLVFWQLATNKQQFLPRLDGNISRICANQENTLYGLTLADSQLVVLSAVDLVSRLHVAGTKARFAKLPPDHQIARRRRRKRQELDQWAVTDYTTSLSIQPSSRNAYLVTDGAQTQAYSLQRDDQEFVVSLAKTLDTGKVRKELEILDPQIDQLGFTTDGQTMISVDSSKPPPGLMSSMDIEVNLKFWSASSNVHQPWTLETRVVNPHGPQTEIPDFVATENSVVTCGSDGSLRLWRLRREGWTLRHVLPGFPLKTRHVALAKSQDGSVLALAHENAVYLLNFAKFSVMQALPNITSSPVRALKFVGKYLVVLAKSRLCVVDLVSLTPVWAIELKTSSNGGRLLAVDESTNTFALAVNHWTPQYRVNSHILRFDPATGPVPVHCYTHPFACGSLALIPGTSSFCFIDQRGVLCTLAGPSAGASLNERSQALLQTSLVSWRETRESVPNESKTLDDGVHQNLDVNSVINLFDSHAELSQLFDNVLTLVS